MTLFRTLYAPVYFLFFVAGAAMLVSTGTSPLWLIGLLIAAIAASLIAERIAPFEAEWNQSHGDTRRDLAHALINEGSILILVLLLPFFASLVPWTSVWPTTLPYWTQLLLAIILWTQVSALPISQATESHCSGVFTQSTIRFGGCMDLTGC